METLTSLVTISYARFVFFQMNEVIASSKKAKIKIKGAELLVREARPRGEFSRDMV